MVTSLNVGCCIEGSYGPLLPSLCNPDGSQVKRLKRQQLEGTIFEARGKKRWLVRFDTGLKKECTLVSLKLLDDPRYNRGSSAGSALGSVISKLNHIATANNAGEASAALAPPMASASAAPLASRVVAH
jgi:hypothetical protein